MDIRVLRQPHSSQYGIYVDGKLIEGGFFSRNAALDTSYEYHGRSEDKTIVSHRGVCVGNPQEDY